MLFNLPTSRRAQWLTVLVFRARCFWLPGEISLCYTASHTGTVVFANLDESVSPTLLNTPHITGFFFLFCHLLFISGHFCSCQLMDMPLALPETAGTYPCPLTTNPRLDFTFENPCKMSCKQLSLQSLSWELQPRKYPKVTTPAQTLLHAGHFMSACLLYTHVSKDKQIITMQLYRIIYLYI